MTVQKIIRRMLWCLGLCVIGVGASAHHSTAMFEWGKEKTVAGTVDKWEWTQPHTFLWVMVPGKGGKVEQYGFEGMSPSWLGRRGWGLKSIARGDKVKLVYYPLRDGRNGGFYVRVTLPDGRTLEALPQRQPSTPTSGASGGDATRPRTQ